MTTDVRPAFYALRSGGWRDYVTLLHPPYTLWHLSYVAIGAGLAPEIRWSRFAEVACAFFLAVGVGAHALDELAGRPLQTRIPRTVLVALATVSIAGAAAIGVVAAVEYDLWLLLFVVCGGSIVVAYNLELAGGRFHSAIWFALSWGAFPALTAYFTMAGRFRGEALLAAAYAFLLSLAQHRLSTVVRTVRRRVVRVDGELRLKDGTVRRLDANELLAAPESALRILAAATVALGLALVLLHV